MKRPVKKNPITDTEGGVELLVYFGKGKAPKKYSRVKDKSRYIKQLVDNNPDMTKVIDWTTQQVYWEKPRPVNATTAPVNTSSELF